jgi:hypothetical protein
MVLLIVVNYEQSKKEQSGKDAANNPRPQREVHQSTGYCRRQEKSRRQNTPPASRGGIMGKFPRG